MIFDDKGLPRDQGATDMLDSARLAGMMALCGHPQTPDLAEYFVVGGAGVKMYAPYAPKRHPDVSAKDFSRDQMLCLAAGLYAQQRSMRIPSWYRPTNGDIMSPSHRDHLKRCEGLPDTWLGRLFLRGDILFHAKVRPMNEPNQLIAMLIVAGPEWVKRWTDANPNWRRSITLYWNNWRGEYEFALMLIAKIESIIK